MSSGAVLGLKLFLRGLVDSISYHRAIPTLVNNNDALLLTLQILGANGFLIFGSYFFFHRAMLPVIGIIEVTAFNINDSGHYNSLVWLIYQSLWLVPICGLCYACSMTWYQSLADSILKHELAKAGNKPGMKSVEYAIYGTIAWVCLFVQVQLLTVLIPMLSNSFEFVAKKVFAPDDSASSVFISSILHALIVAFIRFFHYFSFFLGLILMSMLYAWYAFDPKWISRNISPDERFAILEQHFSYFLGFGVPYVLLNKLAPFFLSFGGFLMLFPFCIILGSIVDFDLPYEDLKVKRPLRQHVRIFKIAQVWTLQALKMAGSKIFKKNKIKQLSDGSKDKDKEDRGKVKSSLQKKAGKSE